MLRSIAVFCVLIFTFLASPAQNCNNWLNLPSYPSYVAVGDLDIPGDQITIEAEINLTQPYGGGPSLGSDIVAKYADPSDVNYLLRAQNAQITTSNGFFQTPDACRLQINKTYHVAMVYDGNSLKFYRNGFLMSQVPATGNLHQNNWITQIGFYQFAFYNVNFIGYINEVRIWNVARTQAQIQAFMNTSLPSPATQTGLLAYYTFNSLINQQGNSSWNGSLGGSAVINQVNTNCPFVLDNDCCPAISGIFTGNSICKGQVGLLSFHPTSSPANPPYTLTYGDPAGTYTQLNVQDNVSFPAIINPALTTQYPLLKITDKDNCSTDITGESATITIIPPGHFKVTPDTAICINSSVQLGVSGGQSYTWTPAAMLNDPNSPNPVSKPVLPTKFYVTGKDFNNCNVIDSVMVNILPKTIFKAPPDKSVCKGMSVVLDGYNGSKNLYAWSPAVYLNNSASSAPLATPDQTTVFNVTITDPVCVQYDTSFTIQVIVNDPPDVVAGKSNDIDCSTLSAQLNASGASTYTWVPGTNLSDPYISSPVATLTATTQFVVQGTGTNGCSATDSVTVIVTKTGQNAFSVPNAFTPNSDGLNDCFGVHNWGNVILQDFSIYNRWGQRVFETKNPSDCWDGTFQGRKQDAGNFVYLIKASSFCGDIIRKGTLLLIR